MIRWVGALCVIVSTTLAGIEHGRKLQRRITQLNTLKHIVIQLYGDVEYGGCTLAESFQRIAAKQEATFQLFLLNLCEKLEKEKNSSLREIFTDAVEAFLKNSALDDRDKAGLIRFGSQFGSVSKNNQLRIIQLYIQELEQVIEELEQAKTEKQKLSKVLGISSGVLIVILLL